MQRYLEVWSVSAELLVKSMCYPLESLFPGAGRLCFARLVGILGNQLGDLQVAVVTLNVNYSVICKTCEYAATVSFATLLRCVLQSGYKLSPGVALARVLLCATF